MQHKYHRQGCVTMKQNVEDRAAMLGEYIVENKATVRRAAKQFGVSKSTVHKDVAERLRSVDMGLYKEVSSVLAVNKARARSAAVGRQSANTRHRRNEKSPPQTNTEGLNSMRL